MSEAITRRWIINGAPRTVTFEPLNRLVDLLRGPLGLTSVKEGCGEGECGACAVLLNGYSELGCLVTAAQLLDGTEVDTAEGLAATPLGNELVRALERHGAVQCGYCSPAMLVAGVALLDEDPAPEERQIRTAYAGHLCRCTGYRSIVDAVSDVATSRAAHGERRAK